MNDDVRYAERQLISRIAAGDEAAFRVFVHRYGSSLRVYVGTLTHDPELTEELVQDIFTQVWLIRETLREIRNMENFLFILARNLSFDMLKKLSRQEKRRLAWQKEASPLSEDMTPMEREVYLTLIEEAIQQLPPQQQRVWIASRKQNKTYQQIAAELQLSRETIKKYLQYATAFIKEYLLNRLEMWWLALFFEKFF